jgi:hypothetical protein
MLETVLVVFGVFVVCAAVLAVKRDLTTSRHLTEEQRAINYANSFPKKEGGVAEKVAPKPTVQTEMLASMAYINSMIPKD